MLFSSNLYVYWLTYIFSFCSLAPPAAQRPLACRAQRPASAGPNGPTSAEPTGPVSAGLSGPAPAEPSGPASAGLSGPAPAEPSDPRLQSPAARAYRAQRPRVCRVQLLRACRVKWRHLLLRARLRQAQLLFSCRAHFRTLLRAGPSCALVSGQLFIGCTLLGLRCFLFIVRRLAVLFAEWAFLSIEFSWFGSLFRVETASQPFSAQKTWSVPIECSRAIYHLIHGLPRERCLARYSYRYLIGTGIFLVKLPSRLSVISCLKWNNAT